MVWKYFLALFVIVLLISSRVHTEEKQGGIVLAFDDGYPSWIHIIAPELPRIGGVATGFVNNQRIHFGDLSFDDLRALQDEYGWEIGTHTYHHFNAPEFVKQKGLSAWITEELEASVTELQSKGLKIQSMVFPYNAFTKELSAEAMKRFTNFRRDTVYPIASSVGEDGSIPGTGLDIGFYVPMEQVFKWIDFALLQDKFLFLYGHKVLPDEEFFAGKVTAISARSLVSKDKIKIPTKSDLCLVPDMRRRVYNHPIKVESITENTINIFQGNLSKMTEVDATYIVGPCYGMQLSYFRKIIEYAAEKRMTFYTISEAVKKMRQLSLKSELDP